MRSLDAKKHTILVGNCWSHIFVLKSTNKDTSQYASTNNKKQAYNNNNLRPQMETSLGVLLHSLKVRWGEVH